MKFAIALFVAFLVCGAQARATEGDVSVQLKTFIDHMEAIVKPALTETHRQIEQIITDVTSAKEEMIEIRNKRAEEFTNWFHSDEDEKLLASAHDKDGSDKWDCIALSWNPMMKYVMHESVVQECIKANSTKFLQLLNKALKTLDETIVVIDNHAQMAKKCIDDVTTVSTSFSATECLAKVKNAVNAALLKVPGKLDSLKLKDRYHQLLKEFEECEEPGAYESFKAKFHSVGDAMRNCITKLIEGKDVKLTHSNFWNNIETSPEDLGYRPKHSGN